MKVDLPDNLTDAQIHDILLSYDHSYGLLIDEDLRKNNPLFCGYTKQEQYSLRLQLVEFYRLIKRTLEENHKI